MKNIKKFVNFAKTCVVDVLHIAEISIRELFI